MIFLWQDFDELCNYVFNFGLWHMRFVLFLFSWRLQLSWAQVCTYLLTICKYPIYINFQGKRRFFVFWEKLQFHKKWSKLFEINWPLCTSHFWLVTDLQCLLQIETLQLAFHYCRDTHFMDPIPFLILFAGIFYTL